MAKINRSLLAGLMILLLLCGLAACAERGPKTVTFEIHVDEEIRTYTLVTEKETMDQALAEAELVTAEDYTTYDGITANPEEGTNWWIVCNGEDMMRAWKAQPVKDGDHYVVTLLRD